MRHSNVKNIELGLLQYFTVVYVDENINYDFRRPLAVIMGSGERKGIQILWGSAEIGDEKYNNNICVIIAIVNIIRLHRSCDDCTYNRSTPLSVAASRQQRHVVVVKKKKRKLRPFNKLPEGRKFDKINEIGRVRLCRFSKILNDRCDFNNNIHNKGRPAITLMDSSRTQYIQGKSLQIWFYGCTIYNSVVTNCV